MPTIRGVRRCDDRSELPITILASAGASWGMDFPFSLPESVYRRAQEQDRTVTVTGVVDGDTVEISPTIGGNDGVRLIGVDTPETVDPNEAVQPYGPQTSRFTTREFESESVTLELDREREDRYGRLLAHVRPAAPCSTRPCSSGGTPRALHCRPRRPVRGALQAGPATGEGGEPRHPGAARGPAVRARQPGQRHRGGLTRMRRCSRCFGR